MRLLTRALLAVMLLAMFAIGLGWFVPERFGILGFIGWVALFWATVMLGMAQLIQAKYSRH